MPLNPGALPAHLAALDAQWERLLEELHTADIARRHALKAYQIAYARAYTGWEGAASADQLRKQVAIGATIGEGADLEKYESEVRFIRDELRALGERCGLARSLYSGVKQATT